MKAQQIYADFYDLEYENKVDDLNFYYNLTKKIKGPILECGCGSGRILMPIAKSGKEIWGFDNNPSMLEITKKKIEKSLSNPKTKIFKDDLTKFSSPVLKNKKFSLIYSSFDSLSYLAQKDCSYFLTEEIHQRQANTFKNISNHLDREGIFAFDLFSSIDLSNDYILRHHFSRLIEKETWNLFSSIQIPDKNIFQIHYFMEKIKNNGNVKRWHYSIFGYQSRIEEIELLLQEAGLKPVQIYGNFELDPYKSESEQMIFVCKKI